MGERWCPFTVFVWPTEWHSLLDIAYCLAHIPLLLEHTQENLCRVSNYKPVSSLGIVVTSSCHHIDLHAQYYEYESYAPYGTNGSHQLSRATTKVMLSMRSIANVGCIQMCLACCSISVSILGRMLLLSFTLSWWCDFWWHTNFWTLPCCMGNVVLQLG